MKRIFLLVVLLCFAASGLTGAAPPRLTGKKPNIVVILTDDQGYGDLSAHGNPILKTPNIDHIHATATATGLLASVGLPEPPAVEAVAIGLRLTKSELPLPEPGGGRRR